MALALLPNQRCRTRMTMNLFISLFYNQRMIPSSFFVPVYSFTNSILTADVYNLYIPTMAPRNKSPQLYQFNYWSGCYQFNYCLDILMLVEREDECLSSSIARRSRGCICRRAVSQRSTIWKKPVVTPTQLYTVAVFCATFQGVIHGFLGSDIQLLGHLEVCRL